MSQWSITAPSSWWVPVIKAIGLCSEPGKGSTDSLSFMSCALIDITDDNAFIVSESVSSALEIDISNHGTVHGYGRALIPVSSLSHAISSLPHDGNIIMSLHDDDSESVDIETSDGLTKFSVPLVDIIDDDMVPHAPLIDGKDIFVPVDFPELSRVYKQGSIMSKSNIGSESLGYDPLSGSIVTIDKGVQVLSLSISSSEAFMTCDVDDDKYTATCISSPQATTSRMDVFASYSPHGHMSIARTGCLILQGNGMSMSVSPLNTGSTKNTTVTYDNIIAALSPAWDNTVVTVTASSQEFFRALSRAGSVSDDSVKIVVDDTSATIHGVDSRRKDYPFTQEISCSTQWNDSNEHRVTYSIDPAVMKKVGTFVSTSDEVIFSIAFDNSSSSPWAMIVYDGDFTVDDPHNFFLIAISA